MGAQGNIARQRTLASLVVLVVAHFASGDVLDVTKMPALYFYGEETDYIVRERHEFSIYVSEKALEESPKLAEAAFETIESQLNYMVTRFPVKAIEKLREAGVKIILNDECADGEGLFCETDYGNCPFACYVPNVVWLEEFKKKSVLIRNLNSLLESTHDQPALLIHEMAHAYHDLIVPLGFDNQVIYNAWEKAKDSGKYEKVPHIWSGDWNNRPHKRAYALQNEREFFAEMTEALWLRNDYAPFTRYDVYIDPVLTDQITKKNPMWDQWWLHSGPHDENPWYWGTLDEESDDE